MELSRPSLSEALEDWDGSESPFLRRRHRRRTSQSQLDQQQQQQQQQPNPLQFQFSQRQWQMGLEILESVLDQASVVLEELDQHQQDYGMVSLAILRTRHEWATAIGQVATELEEQEHQLRLLQQTEPEPEEQPQLSEHPTAVAAPSWNRIQQHQQQIQEQIVSNDWNADHLSEGVATDLLVGGPSIVPLDSNNIIHNHHRMDTSSAVSPLPPSLQLFLFPQNETELLQTMNVITSFLRDVEGSLRIMDRTTADELAFLSLTAARLLVASLQSSLSLLLNQQQQQEEQEQPQMNIELLNDHDDPAVDSTTKPRQPSHFYPTKRRKSLRKRTTDRVRILWPPLGPAVHQGWDWIQDQAGKRPLLAAVVGLTLWPWAVVPVMVGTPIVWLDGMLQDWYTTHRGGGEKDTTCVLLVGLEQGAAQVHSTVKLTLLTAQIVARHAWYIAQHQLERHGGIPGMGQTGMKFAVDRVTHPVETIQTTWNGLCWSWDQFSRQVQSIITTVQQPEQEDKINNPVVQELQL